MIETKAHHTCSTCDFKSYSYCDALIHRENNPKHRLIYHEEKCKCGASRYTPDINCHEPSGCEYFREQQETKYY